MAVSTAYEFPDFPNILQMLYNFLRAAPAWRGYTFNEANRLVEKRLKKRRIPLSDFVAYSMLQDAVQGAQTFQAEIF